MCLSGAMAGLMIGLVFAGRIGRSLRGDPHIVGI